MGYTARNLENIENLEHVKRKIKQTEKLKPGNCPYRLCKVYNESVGVL